MPSLRSLGRIHAPDIAVCAGYGAAARHGGNHPTGRPTACHPPSGLVPRFRP